MLLYGIAIMLLLSPSMGLTMPEQLDTAHWMRDAVYNPEFANMLISEVTLPGTHDSMAFNLMLGVELDFEKDTPDWESMMILCNDFGSFTGITDCEAFINGLVVKWATAQPAGPTEQLDHGIRFFDMRAGWSDDRQAFVAVHTAEGHDYTDIWEEFALWLDNHPEEVVVLYFQNWHNFGSGTAKFDDFYSEMDTYIGNLIYNPLDHNNEIPKVQQMVDMDKRVIVACNTDDASFCWHDFVEGNYPDTFDNSQIEVKNDEYVDYYMKHVNDKFTHMMYYLCWIATPNVDLNDLNEEDWIHLWELWIHTDLLDVAEEANKGLLPWAEKKVEEGNALGNAILFDNFLTVDVEALLKIIYPFFRFDNVGEGFCRPHNCDTSESTCKVNGMLKDDSNSAECKNTCLSLGRGCVGYAITHPDRSSYENRCYVYMNHDQQVASGWTAYTKNHYDIASSSDSDDVWCFRREVQKSENADMSFEKYFSLGDGWCRAYGDAKVNGMYKDGSSAWECQQTCESYDEDCEGYAISSSSYSWPDRCYVYLGLGVAVESGWNSYQKDDYKICHASGYSGVECFNTAQPVHRRRLFDRKF